MNNELRTVGAGASIMKQGALFMVMGPKQIYDFFDKGARYHFLQYGAILASVVAMYWFGEYAIKHGALGALAALVFSAVSVAGLTLVANMVEKLGGWFAWYPGLGYKTNTGTFKPLFGMSRPGSSIADGIGAAKPGETFVRGARVVDGESLAHDLKQGVSAEDLEYLVEWGGVPVPYRSEPEHFLICGKTGAGKSQAINAMLRVVRKRGQAAVVADPIGKTGGYISRFYRPGDQLLNLFDARTLAWSPFAEIREDYDCQRIAKAAIPDANGDSQEWHFYAQTVFAEVLRAMHKRGQNSVKELLRLVMSASVGELVDVLKGSPAEILTAKGNDKMLSNTRGIAAVYLNAWTYLQDGGTFSVRDWVQQSDTSGGKWLFLTYKDDQMALCGNLVATWLEMAVVEGLSLTEDSKRRLWYVMDELDSLGKVTSLRLGLTKLRKYGGVCVAGLQSIAQLRRTYGHDEAQTLASCLSTKLVLLAGDGETAEWCEKELGRQEVIRPETSNSTSQRTGELPSSSENRSTRVVEQPAVLAGELLTLPNLSGFLKLVGLPIARVKLEYTSQPDNMPAFVAKTND